MASKILGTGSAFPERRVTNLDLEKIVETSDEWIRERSGVVERRIAESGNEKERNSSLACTASLRALEMAGRSVEDVDAIFYATCTPDTLVPSTACWLQSKLGAKKAWGIDINAGCSGFLFALSTADQFIRTGQIRTALVIGADILSAFTNWTDRGSCILFGDGAGAVVVEKSDDETGSRIIASMLGTDGTQWEILNIPAGGSNLEITPERLTAKENKIQMRGREIYKVAVKTLTDYAVQMLESNDYKTSDLDWFIPHQANLRIIEAVAKRLDVPMSKVIVNIDRFGNTSAATVPTALDEAVRTGKIQKGNLVLLDVFGAGLTFASTLIRW